ncbi:unnamed protein product [Didymodactylos carnosus]|uniref:Uncharacterized protein n=1 Tax=Didymodactylos carnosus TaxID=1234261 RepID=A0A815E017_9BILA|nr:unnamed protein product [Didymodactylos carnosus]CAF1308323.1 unnamed protein product [Didymodactylos carnosus]CAF3937374.1 unnamed protein product [Didymodactylos carnosus]CAF4143482.1 unnamed protein product [Didymodactylos carnosus]
MYGDNDIVDEIKVIQKIVHVFITTLRICLLKYENNNELLCEKNVHLIELISLFHYSRLFVDNEQIADIINKNGLQSYINLHNIIFDDIREYEYNNYIYINNMMNNFHVEYFKNIIMNSKYSSIEQLNVIRNKLNVCDVKLPILGVAGLNYVIYQDKATLTEHNWSKITTDTRLLINLIYKFFHIFVRSYSNDFSCGTPHRVKSLEGGYLFEKQVFGTIKYNFWYNASCCQLIYK